jgi:hypothetical protein
MNEEEEYSSGAVQEKKIVRHDYVTNQRDNKGRYIVPNDPIIPKEFHGLVINNHQFCWITEE